MFRIHNKSVELRIYYKYIYALKIQQSYTKYLKTKEIQ